MAEIRHTQHGAAPEEARSIHSGAAVATPSAAPSALPTDGWAARCINFAARTPRALVAIALVLAVVARVLLMVRTHAMIDGDEALVGIQAEHILRGERPIYFYGQPYMGSLEAYLAAGLFRVFGPSSWALRAVPIFFSLLLVMLTWRLALALLPRAWRATPLLAGLAALMAAVPPVYDAVTELRAWGGQVEIYVVTLALLLCVVSLAGELRAGTATGTFWWRWALLGFVAGLGIWINPLISYALAAGALWLVAALLPRVMPRLAARLARTPEPADSRRSLAPLAGALALVPGAALGGLPAWIYAAQHAGANLVTYLAQSSVSPAVSGAARHGRLFLGAAITTRYATCVAPHVLDGALPSELLSTLPLRMALLAVPLVGAVGAAWLALRHPVQAEQAVPLRVGLPLLYAGVVSAVFCLSTAAWAETKGGFWCTIDQGGRYGVPLALVEPFLLLCLFAVPALWQSLRARWRGDGRGHLAAPSSRAWSLMLLALLVTGALQFAMYPLVSPSATFQSPYYRRVPLDDTQLLTYLQAHHIQHAWVNHWLGNIVTFQTDGRTVCADYYDQVKMGGIERPPGSVQTVMAATAPSFILIVQDAHPKLAQDLDAQGIPYTLAVLPQAGVTVITPARTVNPATVANDLSVDYPY